MNRHTTSTTTTTSHAPTMGVGASTVRVDLPLQGVNAQGRLEGLLFELTVEQRYQNTSERVIEAVFTFPVPVRAVLLGLELELGDRKLEAVAVAKPEATETYERAIDAGDAAVLLESVGNGLYTVSVGNLKPGESAVIRYRHAELLDANRGLLRMQVPTVIAPRYGDPGEAGLEGPAVPGVSLTAEYPFEVAIELVGIMEVRGITSPSHAIRVERSESGSGTRVGLAKVAVLDRDFVVEVPQANVPRTVQVARDGEEWVAVASAVLEDLPAEQRALALTVLLDCSGSMGGDSIDAAKRAVGRVLHGLGAEDRLGLLRFGSSFQWVTQGVEACTRARVAELRKAVLTVDADLGGTEMSKALTEALRVPVRPGDVADLLLVTDGEVHELERLLQIVAASGRRLFVVAVGAAPNEALARRLTEETGGACEFVASGELAEEAIVRMFRRLRAEPRAVREVLWPVATSWELPAPRAVFPDETVHLIAGFASRPQGAVRVRVGTADGQFRLVEMPVSQMESASTTSDVSALVRVAAARRLPLLSDVAATQLAVRQGIASAFTSLVVVAERSEEEKAQGLPATVSVPQMLAAGFAGAGRVVSEMCAAPAMMAMQDVSAQSPLFSRRAVVGEHVSAADASLPPFGPLSPAAARELLARLAKQAGPIDLSVLEQALAAVDPARVERLLLVQADLGCADQQLVDAFLELLLDIAGKDSAEAQALRQRWSPKRSVFGSGRQRELRKAIRVSVLASGP